LIGTQISNWRKPKIGQQILIGTKHSNWLKLKIGQMPFNWHKNLKLAKYHLIGTKMSNLPKKIVIATKTLAWGPRCWAIRAQKINLETLVIKWQKKFLNSKLFFLKGDTR
jgi:hypothetical protein